MEKGILLGLSLLGLASGLPFLFYDHENGWQQNGGSLPQNGSNFTDSDYAFNFNSGEPLSQMMTYLLFSGSVILPLLLSFGSTGDGYSPLGTNLTPGDKAVKDEIERTITHANENNWNSLKKRDLSILGSKYSDRNLSQAALLDLGILLYDLLSQWFQMALLHTFLPLLPHLGKKSVSQLDI